jgi:hypothetical protein
MTRAKALVQAETGPRVPLVQALKTYNVKLTFTTPILGSAPSSKDVYKNYVASQMPEPTEEKVAIEVDQIPTEPTQVGKTIFRVDPETKHLIYLPHQIRGFMKEAASAITGKSIVAFRSKIDKFVFVSPDIIELKLNGEPIVATTEAPLSTLERPLKAFTAQGPRVSLLSSEQIQKGVEASFKILVLPLAQREITEEVLRAWLDYGQFQGISQWRNGGYGRFTYELTAE